MIDMKTIFEGRKLLVATKHQKEKAIAPVLESALGTRCFVHENFDSDELGTFTGEVERLDDPLTTVRKKCLRAMEQANSELAVASEGSFGPHPQLFFFPCDDELLMLIDKKNNLEIVARELGTDTNFGAKILQSEQDLVDFAEGVMFPSHGIILRKAKDDFTGMVKGIMDKTLLLKTFHELKKISETVYAETDMRALYNPTRMKVIERAAQKLATKIKSKCPQCDAPGFDVTEVKPGLPCSWCGTLTRSTLSYISRCSKCIYSTEEMYPNKKNTEDPMYCDICNP